MSQYSGQNRTGGRYEHGEKYMENLTLRSKKLNENTRENLNSLPKIYAKAAALNRKLSLTSSSTSSTRLTFNNEDELNFLNNQHNTYDDEINQNNNGYAINYTNKKN